jgi:hypothetical protein
LILGLKDVGFIRYNKTRWYNAKRFKRYSVLTIVDTRSIQNDYLHAY